MIKTRNLHVHPLLSRELRALPLARTDSGVEDHTWPKFTMCNYRWTLYWRHVWTVCFTFDRNWRCPSLLSNWRRPLQPRPAPPAEVLGREICGLRLNKESVDEPFGVSRTLSSNIVGPLKLMLTFTLINQGQLGLKLRRLAMVPKWRTPILKSEATTPIRFSMYRLRCYSVSIVSYKKGDIHKPFLKDTSQDNANIDLFICNPLQLHHLWEVSLQTAQQTYPSKGWHLSCVGGSGGPQSVALHGAANTAGGPTGSHEELMRAEQFMKTNEMTGSWNDVQGLAYL